MSGYEDYMNTMEEYLLFDAIDNKEYYFRN